ncbi:MAG: hypothetical protein AAB400_02555 [Patescibacteria group bacterium]
MPFEEKKVEGTKETHKGKRLTRDQFLIVVSLISIAATVAVLFMIVKKNAPPQVVVGEMEQKAKVIIKKVDWRKSLIDTELFQQLKNPLPTPIDVGVVGNPKPFSE